jgi:hypothetical protein
MDTDRLLKDVLGTLKWISELLALDFDEFYLT